MESWLADTAIFQLHLIKGTLTLQGYFIAQESIITNTSFSRQMLIGWTLTNPIPPNESNITIARTKGAHMFIVWTFTFLGLIIPHHSVLAETLEGL
jgi:hypothetical protein